MIEITKSNFLNNILSVEELLFGSTDKLIKYKKYVETDFDKWVWNRINRFGMFVDDPNYVPNEFNSEKYAMSVYNKYVNSYGKSDTDYGEFIRAFNKFAYRYFNDGDDPRNGPYSAIQEFLMNSESTSRKFEICFDNFRFTDSSYFDNNYELMDVYSGRFDELICKVCRGISIFEFGSKDAYGWCNDFISIIDHLIDPIKGTETCQKSCDEYYKNILEFKFEKIYNFISENFGLTRWGLDYEDNFSCNDDTIYLFVKSNHLFGISFEFGKSKYKFYRSKTYELDIDNLDKNILNNVIEMSKINNHILGKNVKIDFDITLGKFLNCLHLEGIHKNDLIEVINDDGKIYSGRIIDLLDPTILEMKIKEFKDNYIVLK